MWPQPSGEAAEKAESVSVTRFAEPRLALQLYPDLARRISGTSLMADFLTRNGAHQGVQHVAFECVLSG